MNTTQQHQQAYSSLYGMTPASHRPALASPDDKTTLANFIEKRGHGVTELRTGFSSMKSCQPRIDSARPHIRPFTSKHTKPNLCLTSRAAKDYEAAELHQPLTLKSISALTARTEYKVNQLMSSARQTKSPQRELNSAQRIK